MGNEKVNNPNLNTPTPSQRKKADKVIHRLLSTKSTNIETWAKQVIREFKSKEKLDEGLSKQVDQLISDLDNKND